MPSRPPDAPDAPDVRLRLRADLYARLQEHGHGHAQAGIQYLLEEHSTLRAQIGRVDQRLSDHIEQQRTHIEQQQKARQRIGRTLRDSRQDQIETHRTLCWLLAIGGATLVCCTATATLILYAWFQ